MLHGLEVGYIEKAPGHIPVTSFSPAARRPAHATALGKALLAFAPADVLRRVGTASLPGFTARTLTRPDQLHHALHRVRCDGRALDRGELNAHVRTVAVPVLGPGDIALAAVEVEVEDLSADTIATVTPVLTLAAHGLTRELHPFWRRNARARHPVRRSGAGVRRLTMPARRVRPPTPSIVPRENGSGNGRRSAWRRWAAISPRHPSEMAMTRCEKRMRATNRPAVPASGRRPRVARAAAMMSP